MNINMRLGDSISCGAAANLKFGCFNFDRSIAGQSLKYPAVINPITKNAMNFFKFHKSFGTLLILFFVVIAANAQNSSDPDIRGTIEKMNRSDEATHSKKSPVSILVKRDQNENGKYDQADIKITRETRIFAEMDKDRRAPLTIDALELNQRVEVRFTSDPALLTYPIQVGAAEIIILSGFSESTSKSGSRLPNIAPKVLNSEITKVRLAINAGNAVWAEAWEKGDVAMLPATFTPDGKELVAGGKIYKGRKQISALLRNSMQKYGGKAKLTVTTKDIWLDGSTAYETGMAVYEFTANGQRQRLERWYFTVWKKQLKGGAWKIYSNTGIARE